EAEAFEGAAASRSAIDAGMAKAIVCLALLGVTQHLIGFVDLLEAFFGALILIDVRVILAGKLTKRLLDLFLVGVARDTQNVVIVAFRGCHWHPLYSIRHLYSLRQRAPAWRTSCTRACSSIPVGRGGSPAVRMSLHDVITQ